MVSIRLCIFIIMNFSNTKSQILQNMDNNIRNFVKIRQSDNNETVQIFITDNTTDTNSNYCQPIRFESTEADPVEEFYTALSCSMGRTIMNLLYGSIKLSPLLYQYKYQDEFSDTYTQGFDSNLKIDILALVLNVKKNAWRYIRILNNVLQTKLDSSYYRQTYTLDALVSLYIKMHFISSTIDDQPTEDIGKSHYNIVRQVLIEMTIIQRSLSINCRAMSGNTNTQFYSFDINENKINKDYDFLNESIIKIQLEPKDQRECSPEEILLESFIIPEQEDEFSKEIARTNVLITSGDKISEKISVESIYQRVNQLYDDEVMFLYQDSIMATIIKIVFREILRDSNVLSDTNVKTIFDKLSKSISDNQTGLPDNLVAGFVILSDFQKNGENKEYEKMQRFYDSFPNIDITTKTEEANQISYLIFIFQKINERIAGIQCFQEMYKYLGDKRKKNYLPSTMISYNGTLSSDSESLDDMRYKRLCNFLVAVNALCFQTLMYVQQDLADNFYVNSKDVITFNTRPTALLNTILNFFLLIIENVSAYKSLRKMAYTIAPILLNIMQNKNMRIPYIIEWVLYIVMAELNAAGMMYCVSYDTNFLLFNQTEFFDLGNLGTLFTAVVEFFEQHVDADKPVHTFITKIKFELKTNHSRFDHLYVNQLYEMYIKESNVFPKYINKIQFYWYGRRRTVEEIFQNTISIVTNPQNLYAIYDMYFKFLAAAIYYEIKKILNQTDFNDIKNGLKSANDVCELQEAEFPSGLRLFVLYVNELLKLPSKMSMSETSQIQLQLKEHEDKIDKLLVELNIVISYDKSSESLFQKVWKCVKPDRTFQLLQAELSGKVKRMYKNYKKIILEV